MFTKFTAAALLSIALLGQTASAQYYYYMPYNTSPLIQQIDEMIGYANEIEALIDDNPVGHPLGVELETKLQETQAELGMARYYANFGAVYRVEEVRQCGFDLRAIAFDLYYASPNDRFVAYRSWFYGQSIMLIANDILQD